MNGTLIFTVVLIRKPGRQLTANIRVVGEPILASQFGEANMDDLFRRFEEDVLDHMEKENCQFINDLVDKEGLNKKNM
ncbi:hypothetical protein ACFX2G_035068 [Malus domestica]